MFCWVTAPSGQRTFLTWPAVIAAYEAGADVLEVAVEQTELVSARGLRAAVQDNAIGLSICGASGPSRDLSSEDGRTRDAALRYIKQCIDLAHAVGAANVVGPLYSAVGKARPLSPEDRREERQRAVEGLKAAADYAALAGVSLAIEPLNRFETDMVNTAEQGLELCDLVGKANVGLTLDTFHMNIEEKSPSDAIRAAGDRLLHVQVCANDRGTPGTGHLPWEDIFRALRDVGYAGQIVIESFTPSVGEIAKAVSLWRPLDATGGELASKGVAFLRRSLATREALQ
ncbi:MAG TPA: sugar phosphate isomerase/epimerase family protein [Acidimicrobiales bacterium]|nr:sugar phosphate isomerase/epimerase family protein [Acidimicrobiales bacterium]